MRTEDGIEDNKTKNEPVQEVVDLSFIIGTDQTYGISRFIPEP